MKWIQARLLENRLHDSHFSAIWQTRLLKERLVSSAMTGTRTSLHSVHCLTSQVGAGSNSLRYHRRWGARKSRRSVPCIVSHGRIPRPSHEPSMPSCRGMMGPHCRSTQPSVLASPGSGRPEYGEKAGDEPVPANLSPDSPPVLQASHCEPTTGIYVYIT